MIMIIMNYNNRSYHPKYVSTKDSLNAIYSSKSNPIMTCSKSNLIAKKLNFVHRLKINYMLKSGESILVSTSSSRY